ncbi:hypothetical protein [Microbacterium sp.]|uniref:hypothetical protein n=1 Tax=Microbacterium sp. TaxID=51671 RepID=UPI0039E5A129
MDVRAQATAGGTGIAVTAVVILVIAAAVVVVLLTMRRRRGAAREAGPRPIRHVVFACDAGIGAAVVGATVLRKRLAKAGIDDVDVTIRAISQLDRTVDLVITQSSRSEKARAKAPDALHISIDNVMTSAGYDDVVRILSDQRHGQGSPS